ncbi:MAG: gamma-glutamyl-gamma-aminobutyrate hydrolase family protein [Peptoniphilaceae bacterium]
MKGYNKNQIITDEDKPIIGISWFGKDEFDENTKLYTEAVIATGGKPILIPKLTNQKDASQALNYLDGVILAGGVDINPELYNEIALEEVKNVNDERDRSDFLLLKECEKRDMVTLGICRGMQIMNVFCGGSLYQDLNKQYTSEILHRYIDKRGFLSHNVFLEKGNILSESMGIHGKYEVTSWHHQAIKELGENLKVVAKSEDGLIEAIVKTDNSYFYGVQWHPEKLIDNRDIYAINMYKSFMNEAKKRKISF